MDWEAAPWKASVRSALANCERRLSTLLLPIEGELLSGFQKWCFTGSHQLVNIQHH
jgi:hypothetical protein